MKKIKFHVSGTHCPSCKILIEDILSEQDLVENVRVDLNNETVEIETQSDKNDGELMQIFGDKIKSHKYTLSLEKNLKTEKSDDVIWKALPIGLGILVLFFVLQKSGILNFGIGGKTTPVTSFVVGLVASVSSCLAIVGGLILSLSAKISQDNIDDKKNIILFHTGRIVSFALLGGLLGMIGGAVGVSFTLSSKIGRAHV